MMTSVLILMTFMLILISEKCSVLIFCKSLRVVTDLRVHHRDV